jgi:hypothetical protein
MPNEYGYIAKTGVEHDILTNINQNHKDSMLTLNAIFWVLVVIMFLQLAKFFSRIIKS